MKFPGQLIVYWNDPCWDQSTQFVCNKVCNGKIFGYWKEKSKLEFVLVLSILNYYWSWGPLFSSCYQTFRHSSFGSSTLSFAQCNVKNGILFPKLFWPTVRKNCFTDRQKLFEITRTIYSSSERSEVSEQFLVTECYFNLFLEVSKIW